MKLGFLPRLHGSTLLPLFHFRVHAELVMRIALKSAPERLGIRFGLLPGNRGSPYFALAKGDPVVIASNIRLANG
jgi:hypothetical protein